MSRFSRGGNPAPLKHTVRSVSGRQVTITSGATTAKGVYRG